MRAEDLAARGWDGIDFLIVSGDAYVDHPSFAPALLGRLLESRGFRVGVAAQPDWRIDADMAALGRPRLAVLIAPGNLDSMVARYTVEKRRRARDEYSPGGRPGRRPDRAAIVYASLARKLFPGTPVILGGIEASLRRFAHYDYWDDRVRRPLLFDAKADMIVYGMGERALLEVASLLERGARIGRIRRIRGTCVVEPAGTPVEGAVEVPSFEAVAADKDAFLAAFRAQYAEQDALSGRPVLQPCGDRLLVQNPPAMPLCAEELDALHELPFARRAHPMYEAEGGVPALEEVRWSVAAVRGCYGSCAFCSLHFHQGRVVRARSAGSILREIEGFTRDGEFRGVVHDIGGPTANFRAPACELQERGGACRDRRCLHPKRCAKARTDHAELLALLRAARSIPGVRKVFLRSGLRFDHLLADPSDELFGEIVEHHISGRMKVAPEHVADRVLDLMGKPRHETWRLFEERFRRLVRLRGVSRQLVPYYLSSHPGSTLADAVALAEHLARSGRDVEQVQDFYPTPGTLATCMYHTGRDPFTGKPVHVARDPREKAMQRALLQPGKREHRALVLEALRRTWRMDLVGRGPGCLIPPGPDAPEPSGEPARRTRADRPDRPDRPPRGGKGGRR